MNTPRTMITFKEHGCRFTYRVGGVAVYNNHVFLQYAGERDPWWFLPGGRAELFESAEGTLCREMREELEVEIRIERLLYVLENFFVHDSTPHHELGLYFLMAFPAESYLYAQKGPFIREEGGKPIVFSWHPIDELVSLPAYPSFFHEALRVLPNETMHAINIDEGVTLR